MPEDDGLAQILARCTQDADFKARFINDPRTVLGEFGINCPPGIEVDVLQNTEDKVHIMLLPDTPPVAELSNAELMSVAGGGGDTGLCASPNGSHGAGEGVAGSYQSPYIGNDWLGHKPC